VELEVPVTFYGNFGTMNLRSEKSSNFIGHALIDYADSKKSGPRELLVY
jgi:hypothetical protein